MNPYAPPKAEPSPERATRTARDAYIRGNTVIVPGESRGPALCVKCGSGEHVVVIDKDLSALPGWVTFAPGWYCLALLFRVRHVRLGFGLCPACDTSWRTARAVELGAAVLAWALVALIISGAGGTTNILRIDALLIAVLALQPLMVRFFVAPRTVRVKSVVDGEIALVGVAPEVAGDFVDGVNATRRE